MQKLKSLNPPTKALFALVIPSVYLLVLNKVLWLVLYLSFNITNKEYTQSGLVIILNILAGSYFIFETAVFLYSKKRRHE